MNVTGFPRVQGDLVGSGWETRCWRLEPETICDPNVGTGPLQRRYAVPSLIRELILAMSTIQTGQLMLMSTKW